MKLVYTHDNMAVVHSAKNLLEMNDIDCLIKNEHGYTMGAEFGTSNLTEVWVLDPNKYQKALAIIEDKVNSPQEKKLWVCSECKEKNEGCFEICWRCQSEMPSS